MSKTTLKVRPTANIEVFANVASAYLFGIEDDRLWRDTSDSLDGCDDWDRERWLTWLRPRGLVNDSLEGRVILYTGAPACYDGFGTETLVADAGSDTQGRVLRKVAVLAEHLDWQRTRYSSGLHGSATPEEASRFRSIWTIRDEEAAR